MLPNWVRKFGAQLIPIPETKGLKFRVNGREKIIKPPKVISPVLLERNKAFENCSPFLK